MSIGLSRPLPGCVAMALLLSACGSGTPVGPGIVSVTKTTTSTTTSTIAPPTTADFSFSPLTPRALQSVVFNAGTSVARIGRTIALYTWDFGDGGTASGATASAATRAYALEGTYNVTLTVTDSAGEKATVSRLVPVVGVLSTTTTTVVPTTAGVRFVTTAPGSGITVPTDMTLFFQLTSGTTYSVQGIYSTNAVAGIVVHGLVQGQMVGAITPSVSGTFTGTMTSDRSGCTAPRTFSGSIGPLLTWTAGSQVDCVWPFVSFALLRSDAPPATTTISLRATTGRIR